MTRLSRRALVRGAALAPFVPLTLRRASAAKRPTRLLLVYHPNGLELGWAPTGGETDFKLSPVLEALAPFRNKLVIASGFQGGIQNEVQGHGEGMTSLWTGSRIVKDSDFAGAASIDQIIAARVGAGTSFRSLEFGVQSQSGNMLSNTSAMIYAGPGRPVQPEDDPNKMFERVFATALADPTALQRLRAEQKSVFDLVRGQLSEIRGHYGTADRRLLDQHQQFLAEIEARATDPSGMACAKQYTPHMRTTADARTQSRLFPEMARLQVDLATLSLACGLTRVASVQYTHSTSNTTIPGVNGTIGIHGVMHTRTREEKVSINKWFVGELAYLLGKLEGHRFADGTTLLDETLVVWGTEMAVGNHLNYPIPFVVAGGGQSGYFKLGRWMNLASRPRHTRLLVSVAQAMGVEDVQGLGDFQGDGDRGALEELRQ